MWGAVKDKFYADKLETIDALKDNIREAIGEIQLHTIDNTLEQRWEILRHFFEHHDNVAVCMQKLRTDFGRKEAPSAPYVRYLVVILFVILFVHRRSQQLNISETSLKRILHKDLGIAPHTKFNWYRS